MSRWSGPAEFVDALSEVALPDVFNPYRDRCETHDRHDAPAIRRRNLCALLDAALAADIDEMWIGLELGRLGGRRTGLPFADELSLPALTDYWQAEGIERATHGPPVKEQSATYIWQALASAGGRVFLWNVFPFQCTRPGAITNRGHSRAEAELGAMFLDWIVEQMKPARLTALGRDTEAALRRQGKGARYVRHPGRGGGPAFLAAITQ